MMDGSIKAIYTRRSIRKYASVPVQRDVLSHLVKAGMNAPSAGDQQPWHLGVYPRMDRVEGMRALQGIPESVIPFSIIAVGCPAEVKDPKNCFRPEWVHENRWAG